MRGPWTCRSCTFHNKKFIVDNAICEVCHTSRKKRPASESNDANSSVIDLCYSPPDNKKRRVTMSNDTASSAVDLYSSHDNKKRRRVTASSVIDVRSPDNVEKKNETRIFGDDPSNRMNTSAAPMADDEKRKGSSQSKLNDTATSTENVSAASSSTSKATSTSRTKKNVSAASSSTSTVMSRKNVSAVSTSKATSTSSTKNVSAVSTSKATSTSSNDSHPSASEDDAVEKLNQDGIVLFNEGKYAEAATKFQAALDITSISPEKREILTNSLGKALIGIGSHNSLLDALTCFTWCIEQLSSQEEEERRIRYTLSHGMALASILYFDESYLQQAIEDFEYVFRHSMARVDQKEKCFAVLKIIVNTMKELNPDSDAFPQTKGRWTPLEMECFDNALLVLGVDDFQKNMKISPCKIARLIAKSIPGRDYSSCEGHCKARHTSVAESKGKRKTNTTNQKTLDQLRQIRVGWESLESLDRQIEMELVRAKLERCKQRIHDENKPIEPIVQAAFIAARQELQDGVDPEPLNLGITKPRVTLLSEYNRRLGDVETSDAILNNLDTKFAVRNAYDSTGWDTIRIVARLLHATYQSFSGPKKDEIRKSIMCRMTIVDITASGLSILQEDDVLVKLVNLFSNVPSNQYKCYDDEELVLGDDDVSSKRTLVINDHSTPGQYELGQFVGDHANEFNAENTTSERKEEILQDLCSLFDMVIRGTENGTFKKVVKGHKRRLLRKYLIGSSAELVPNSQREKTEVGNDDVIFTNNRWDSDAYCNHPGNIDMNDAIDSNYPRARISSQSKVASEIYQAITEGGGKVLYEKDGMLYECTVPRAITLIRQRINNKLSDKSVIPGSAEDVFLKELEAIDANETTKHLPPAQKNALKFQAAKRAVQAKNSPYRTCREYNAIRRIMSRYRKAEDKGIRKEEVSGLVGLETAYLIDWFDQGMPEDCDWEEYLEGKVHIDHRQSLQGQIQQFGEKNVEQRWHFTNLWLLNGKKNSGKGGARGDNPNREWNSVKNRWVETSDEDEKLVKEFINNFGPKSQIMKCSV